jgi:hypothetical protein
VACGVGAVGVVKDVTAVTTVGGEVVEEMELEVEVVQVEDEEVDAGLACVFLLVKALTRN